MATEEKVKALGDCYCGRCMSDDVKEITEFQGKAVVPDDKYDDNNTGIVVQCNDCSEISGFLVILTGVVDENWKDE